MLEKLRTKIESEVPRALANRCNYDDLDSFLHREGVNWSWRPSEVRKASVRFFASDLCNLPDDDFVELEIKLKQVLIQSFAGFEMNVPTHIAEIIQPESELNVLHHERRHFFEDFPKPELEKSFVDLVLVKAFQDALSGGRTDLWGFAIYDPLKLTRRQKALSCSNPEVLSKTDHQAAILYAKSTNDPIFIQEIEERLKSKRIHG